MLVGTIDRIEVEQSNWMQIRRPVEPSTKEIPSIGLGDRNAITKVSMMTKAISLN
jgi:hypothetical protein